MSFKFFCKGWKRAHIINTARSPILIPVSSLLSSRRENYIGDKETRQETMKTLSIWRTKICTKGNIVSEKKKKTGKKYSSLLEIFKNKNCSNFELSIDMY